MNPPSSRSGPFQDQHDPGCEGDGCASAADTWPLHHVYRRGVRGRLCNSCILLAHRSYYCCSCFFLIPLAAQWSIYEEGDPFVAPPRPIATCRACREAVAHLACLAPPTAADGRAFVCPACSAAAEGRPFAYERPGGAAAALDERAARMVVVGTRLALVLLQRSASLARAEAERLARTAADLRRRAYQAVGAALDVDTEIPYCIVNADPPSSSENGQEVGEGSGAIAPPVQQQQQSDAMPPPMIASENRRPEAGGGSRTGANAPRVRRRRNALPQRRTASERRRMEVGEGSANEPLLRRRRHAMASRTITSENRMEPGVGSGTSADATAMPPLSGLTIGTGRVTQLAMAATAAARDSLPPPRTMPLFSIPEEAAADAVAARPPTPPTLQLFPTKASSSRTSPRTLQLFKDKMPGDGEM